MEDFDDATFLRDQASRGPSVARRVYRALVWAEKSLWFGSLCIAPCCRITGPGFQGGCICRGCVCRMATTAMLTSMEAAIDSAQSLPLRVYAGMCCALAHGVLRWRDLLRSEDLHLTADALVGVTWLMKKKSRKIPWAALRRGLTNTDWAGRWVCVLTEAGLPGADYVLMGVSSDFLSFRPRVASYSDGVNAMRMLLVNSGMEPQVALSFTLHSWRHLFPTAARQLRLPEHGQVEMGHWATGTSILRRYDSMACFAELIAKSKITDAFSGGWEIA